MTASYDYSLVIPCFNEEEVLPLSIPPLRALLKELGLNVQLVLVDNGSRDRTGAILDAWAETDSAITVVRLAENRCYGGGVLAGHERAEGKVICHLCADGQIGRLDVVRILLAIRENGPGTLVKAWRVRGHESAFRKLSSVICRLLFRLCFGSITPDPNGTPKALYRDDLEAMALGCPDDFLDAEVIIKADCMAMKIVEVPVEFLPRAGGDSKVSGNFVSHFARYVRQLARFRFGGGLKLWKENLECQSRNATLSKSTSCTSVGF